MRSHQPSPVEGLATIPRYADVPPAEWRALERLAAGARVVGVPAGWPLIDQGTPGDSAYLVLAGTASITRAGTQVARIGAGDLVGELALARTRLRSATVVADEPCRLLHLDAAQFVTLQRDCPALYAALAAHGDPAPSA